MADDLRGGRDGGRGGGRGGGRSGGRGGGRGDGSSQLESGSRGGGVGRGVRPAAARRLSYTESSAVVPDPVPCSSFDEELKRIRVARARDRQNLKKMSKEQLCEYRKSRDKKQVQYSLMPDAPPRTRVSKKASPTRHPCRLRAGVPEVPPRRVPQPWEVPGPSRLLPGVPDVPPSGQPQLHELPGPCRDTSPGEDEENVIEGTPLHSPIKIVKQLLINQTATTRAERPAESPPAKRQTTPHKKQRTLTPTTGVNQAAVSPSHIVEVDFEYIGFTTPPRASTLASAASVSSASPSSAPGNFEDLLQKELKRLGGSDADDDVGITLRRRSVNEFPSLDVEELGEELFSEAVTLDAEADAALHDMVLDPAYLHFDWSADPQTFEGLREVFAEQTGPTFSLSGAGPLDLFKKIWDDDMMAKIVQETNRYAHQQLLNCSPKARLISWKDVSLNELWTFFAIMMMQSLVPCVVEREYWYPRLPYLKIGNFSEIMPYDRFILLKRCLRFDDNSRFPKVTPQLAKILPVIRHLNRKFESLYVPEQNIALDESLLLWKGRLSFAQLIKNKKARVGIKTYEICESRTGYLWKMDLYAGKGEPHSIDVERHEDGDDLEVELEGATSQIVLKLMRPLLNKGYTLVMDNFYNSPLLTRILKKQFKTDTMGTLRLNREFVPDSLKKKKITNMRIGEFCSSCTKDVSVVVWRDSNLVSMISSFHPVDVGGREKHGVFKYRPQVVLDYNNSMGGVDKKDQMLHQFPVERLRNKGWYKKLFRRLVNVSIHNAFVLFSHGTRIPNREFRMRLVDEIMRQHPPAAVGRPQRALAPPPPPPPPTSTAHTPSKGDKWQRCKLCSRRGARKTTQWSCKACRVNLCHTCFEDYHK